MRKTVLLFFILAVIVSCKQSTDGPKQSQSAVAARWELVSNFADTGSTYTARFRLFNKENLTLNSNNWALFFSAAGNPIVDGRVSGSKGRVDHVNGDWFKLTIDSSVKKGDSVDVIYRSSGSVIKNTDAPSGIYVVFYDTDGKEERIAQLSDFTLVPFTKKEQLLRGKADKEVAASPAKTFWENDELSVVNTRHLLPIVPTPKQFIRGQGSFRLGSEIPIVYSNDTKNEAELLAAYLKEITGRPFTLTPNSSDFAIRLAIDPALPKNKSAEGYQLNINAEGVAITGFDAAGVFYGIQSLLALVPTDVYLGKNINVDLPFVAVEDAPRFGFRSVHLDVARNFQTKETVLKTLDVLARYKINHLLLYTSEDEGWRIEIPGLPELTEVGAKRRHVSSINDAALHPAYGSGPFPDSKDNHGTGYYTRADFIEILKYAAARHIKVIPELNFPGHARAAIKSMEARYHRLMKEGKEEEANEYRLVDPEDKSEYLSAQLFKDNVVNVSRESTFRFFEKVVDEFGKMYTEAGLVMDVFHAGGDEVAEGAWTKSPEALELLQRNPEIQDPKNLQTYFFRELVKRLEKRNLTIHGWEEVALLKDSTGKYIPNPEFADKKVVPYIWNNLFDYPDLGYQLANAGYNIVLCNVSNFYFDLAYDNDPLEPGAYWAGFINTKNAFAFAPFHMFNTTFQNDMGADVFYDNPAAGLQALHREARKNIIGVEAQLWSETIKGREMLEYYMLPKLMGFSESAWAAERRWEDEPSRSKRIKQIEGDWNFFANTIAQREFPKLSKINGGYNYRVPPAGAIIENGMMKANVSLPGLKIHYTIDGSEPTTQSPVYKDPIPANVVVKLKTFDAAGRSGRTVTQRPIIAGRLN